PELAARVRAVAEAGGPTEALQAIALAKSACRLMRVRLPIQGVPEGWTPLNPPKKSRGSRTEGLMPIARLILDGREVWACARPNRSELLLVEPPFPAEAPAETPAVQPQSGGIFGRLRRQLGQARGGEAPAPSRWLNDRLRGALRWQAQYPLGAQGDIGCWA